MKRKEVLEMLKISPYYLRDFVAKGLIKTKSISSRDFEYDEEDVKKLLDSGLCKKLGSSAKKSASKKKKAKKSVGTSAPKKAVQKALVDVDAPQPPVTELSGETLNLISEMSGEKHTYMISAEYKDSKEFITVTRVIHHMSDVASTIGSLLYALEVQCHAFVTDEVYQNHIEEITTINDKFGYMDSVLNELVFSNDNIAVRFSKHRA